MIRTGDIDPAYLIFARFQQRNRERMQHAIELLKSEPDWTANESFAFDRAHAAWPLDQAAMDELWRKRVKNDALSLMLTGKAWPDAAEVLRKRYERVLKRVDQVSSEDVFEGLMNAYARAFDPHSSYFSPRSSEEYRIQMSLNYEGIGASLQVVDDYVTIMNVLEGDRKSTRLNSSHSQISYAVFCLKQNKALMFLTLMRPSLVLFLVLWLMLVKDFLKVRCRLALLPVLISCLIWLDLVASLPLIKERILVIILLLHFLSLMLGSVLVLMLPLFFF